ncbi:MAG: UDP-N-acetylmuramate dehydrogenase [bacterium]|nr:UDP-N-acetylmuramate dehydrogenase [bacterium]
MTQTYPILEQTFGDRIKKDFNLSPYLTMKMQIVAQYYFEPTSIEDWQRIVTLTFDHNIPFLVLGGGSNLTTFQGTIPGVTIRNRYVHMTTIDETDTYVDLSISSGYPMGHVVKETVKRGLSGFEYHLGLPGTLGGAIYMNSKWTKPISYVSDRLLLGTLLDKNGTLFQQPRDYFEFAYDYSTLQQTGDIFLEGVFRLSKEDPTILEKRAQEALEYRKQTQPMGVATVGCFFQNISKEEQSKYNLPTQSAGYLIDQAGMKGKRVGDFHVSEKHANFIINSGYGKPEDLQELMRQVKEAVKNKYTVELIEEVRVI